MAGKHGSRRFANQLTRGLSDLQNIGIRYNI